MPNNILTFEKRLKLRINRYSFENALGYKRFAMFISNKFFKMKINFLFWEKRYAKIKHFSRQYCNTTK